MLLDLLSLKSDPLLNMMDIAAHASCACVRTHTIIQPIFFGPSYQFHGGDRL